MTTKRCPRCGVEKPLIDFNRQKSKKDGQHICQACAADYRKEWLYNIFRAARYRAAAKSIPFTITFRYLKGIVPNPFVCPLLGLPLRINSGSTSPSLDRIIPEFGYVPKNVMIVSWRANTLKRDARAAELSQLAARLREIEEAAIRSQI